MIMQHKIVFKTILFDVVIYHLSLEENMLYHIMKIGEDDSI